MNKKYNNADSKNTPAFIPQKAGGDLGVNSNNIAQKLNSPSCPNVLMGLGVKASPWGRLVGLLFIFLAFTATAQPLPPSTPFGSPVPVGGALVLLLAMAGLGVRQLMKRRNK